MRKILVLCNYNLLRGPLLEDALSSRLPRSDYLVSSGGIQSAPKQAVDRLKAEFIFSRSKAFKFIEGRTSLKSPAEEIRDADLILVHTQKQLAHVTKNHPSVADKVFLIKQLLPKDHELRGESLDIEDYGHGEREMVNTVNEMASAIAPAIRRLLTSKD